jgi:phytoene/squalene synthetase
VTISALPLVGAADVPRPPAAGIFGARGFEPGSALGRLFAPARDFAAEAATAQWVAGAPRRLLGELAEVVSLLPVRERERAAILAAWVEALMATADESDALERRTARLNRSAYLLARALAGEPSDAPFVRAFAAESARRAFTRPALDALLGAARRRAERSRPRTVAEWDEEARTIGESVAAALAGTRPSVATVEAAAGLYRLLLLRGLPDGLAAGRVRLPEKSLPEPLQYRSREEISAAAAGECEAIRPLLLRGARALGEVPLTYRRPLAFLLSAAIALLGEIEVHPEALTRRAPRLSWWTRRSTLWRVRRQPLD